MVVCPRHLTVAAGLPGPAVPVAVLPDPAVAAGLPGPAVPVAVAGLPGLVVPVAVLPHLLMVVVMLAVV